MNGSDLLADAFGRIQDEVRDAVAGLDAHQLADRVDGTSNSIGWLVWHLTRVQDDHVADVAGLEQVWTAGGFADRFALALPVASIGYGHTTEEVDAVRVADPALLVGYHQAVHDQTVRYLATLTGGDFDRVVDERWEPPVTLGVRLISVVSDDLQHVGQAAFLRGIIERRQS
ncbi:Protein of unknown function (DUF664) [Frankia torreyi]|uniref:DUF664 domain-containing protein n=2 Tax=Frankia TaxID=1854 RepID=A0A0D8B943_9ACTN|nr:MULTISPECIES: DUF664 domain-containing protein [Frankia]KJE20449.1 Protein of unknown function (DUF664) [Frankia torreyi]KQC36183.1 hypothetical protein UK82_22200 [Frankia sp. ACN1ag]KQM02759.1 Protein of unknown function (DUF664) [Frankia sp. CpI1-P]